MPYKGSLAVQTFTEVYRGKEGDEVEQPFDVFDLNLRNFLSVICSIMSLSTFSLIRKRKSKNPCRRI